MADNTIEHEIQAKGLNAPRITPADVEANIASTHYFSGMDGVCGNQMMSLPDYLPLKLLTFCVLVLRNGLTVTGMAYCASPERFDAVKGREVARKKALDEVWPLMYYELKQRLHEQQEHKCCGKCDTAEHSSSEPFDAQILAGDPTVAHICAVNGHEDRQ